MTTSEQGIDSVSGPYYDPYDFAVDSDPYPTWRRMRDEAPLYYNEAYNFYALTRFDDVMAALTSPATYRSGRGTLLELIRNAIPVKPGMFLFEDSPVHDVHRRVLAGVFTPRAMLAIEAEVRRYCEQTLDPLVGQDRFDLVKELGAVMPMRVIGMLLGIPETWQVGIRDGQQDSRRLSEGAPKPAYGEPSSLVETFGEYVDWRRKNPSDDLTTALLNAEFEDETGTTRRLTRTESITFMQLLAGAGNETTSMLIGWMGKVLAEHPDQLREVAADRTLVPNVVEELLRFEAPSPVQARYVDHDVELHDQLVPEASIMLLLNGSANRDDRQFERGDSFDIHRHISRHATFGVGLHFCLGAALARLEGRVALDELLKRWPHWEVDLDNAIQARTSTTRGWESLPIAVSTS